MTAILNGGFHSLSLNLAWQKFEPRTNIRLTICSRPYSIDILKPIKPSDTEKKSLFSYNVKTTMLWASEERHPDDPVWSSLEASVQMLLARLVDGLQKGIIPHYFLPEINLLERVDSDIIDLAIGMIMSIQENPYEAFPDEIDEKMDAFRLGRSLCEKGEAIASLLLEEECKFFAIMPQLLVAFDKKK